MILFRAVFMSRLSVTACCFYKQARHAAWPLLCVGNAGLQSVCFYMQGMQVLPGYVYIQGNGRTGEIVVRISSRGKSQPIRETDSKERNHSRIKRRIPKREIITA